MIKNDCLLVQEVQQWNYTAFEKLYEKYLSRIYAFLMTKSGWNVSLSQDICSETFMKAFENIETFCCGENSSFSARLYRIAYHSFIDAIKKKDTDISLDETLIVTEKVDYVDLFQKKEQMKEILQYLDTLWDDKKTIFLLRIWENMNYNDIAIIVDKTAESCRQEFSRTLKKLLEKFKNFS